MSGKIIPGSFQMHSKYLKRINSVIKVLKEEFPDRKIIEIPADVPVEFVD